ncbi:MAG: hypothetical protein GY785_24035 [Gammaproteobacteria bacterium]|nr:hypothetical protein [Gammaproteobacteria bacterium]
MKSKAGLHRHRRRSRLATAGFWLALTLALPITTSSAVENLDLLGFVKSLCADEANCFELMVKPEFAELAGERLKVRFDADTRIFDPENYELTLAQQNIIPGSHLRLLLEKTADAGVKGYRAAFIWIGD